MPGPISISFSPIDAGTNHDPRTLNIINKLSSDLDDAEKAAYHSYIGCTSFSFGPKFIRMNQEEVGEYKSISDILQCAKSIDDTYSFFIAYIKNGSDSRNTAWVKCENDDFDQVSGALIHSDDTTRERKIYEYAIKDNATFNMYSAIGVAKYPNDLFKGRNTTCITIVKDDYYFYEWNAFSGKQTKYSTRMWSCNYFINRIKNYNSKMHYIIDLRPQSDNLLKDM